MTQQVEVRKLRTPCLEENPRSGKIKQPLSGRGGVPNNPIRTQPLDALAGANAVRMAQAGFRRQVEGLGYRNGCKRVADCLLDPDDTVASFKVGRLLHCVFRVGSHSTREMLLAAGLTTVSECRRVGPLERNRNVPQLTQGQRARLRRVLYERAAR